MNAAESINLREDVARDQSAEYHRVNVTDIPAWVAKGWRVSSRRTFGSTVEWVWMRREDTNA